MIINKRQTEHGFSVIEVMFSLGIFGVLSLGLATSLISNLKTNTRNQVKTEALQVARTTLDRYRVSKVSTLPTTGSVTSTQTIGSHTYSVSVTFCSNAAYCATEMRHLIINVSQAGTNYSQIETVFTQLK